MLSLSTSDRTTLSSLYQICKSNGCIFLSFFLSLDTPFFTLCKKKKMECSKKKKKRTIFLPTVKNANVKSLVDVSPKQLQFKWDDNETETYLLFDLVPVQVSAVQRTFHQLHILCTQIDFDDNTNYLGHAIDICHRITYSQSTLLITLQNTAVLILNKKHFELNFN
ncbi:hypothetical protein RFI_07076 [Reticulomyxa filosa]|uniref:Uncharacterized protein n=1 Tax=Reticulomyxa filosa TaxID=46433 RepID=X6NXP6_RETFI|nr:hypothetical protein RFI_07076 [Reticulomyxa filosa]|eukprot:ETO30047.1 hypothetical protein RFI_07076 [Reticulomyxa filosa]